MQVGEVLSGGSYLSQSDLRLHFGLGSKAIIDKLEVFWPTGDVQSFHDLATNQFYKIKQGGAVIPIVYRLPARK